MYGKAKDADEMSGAIISAVAKLNDEFAADGRTINDHDEVVITLSDIGEIVDVWLEPGITSRYEPHELAQLINEQLAILRGQFDEDQQYWDNRLYELLGDFRDIVERVEARDAAADTATGRTSAS
ncbi:hypothetical protein [Tsukamurella ocularis]|uniref:hypothetical protein n=1 Tax=Tsukamurella ocularis TaxID=1970234 RepID=UPI002169B541|nr:hypothetical protein [Tsukamurella ocularis]MCS3853309.1 hypothetical protein [Tsukamurella ocularis]